MSKKSKNRFFNNYEDLSVNITDSDFEMAKEFLEEFGINTDDIMATGVKEFSKITFLIKARANQSRDKSLIEKLQSAIQDSLERNAKLTGEILQNALSKKKASFQFRSLDKWSDEEIREVLIDIDLVKLLEDLENMED